MKQVSSMIAGCPALLGVNSSWYSHSP